MEDENWAKPENADVESAKTAFTEAQEAAQLRQSITNYAIGAVKHGNVNRDWVNGWLSRLGADPVVTSAEYRINIPITGNYGTTVVATSRAEAMRKFEGYVQWIIDKGEVRSTSHGQGVFNVALNPDAGPASIFDGPQDPPVSDTEPGLDALKDGIRAMLKEGVAEQGWEHRYAEQALEVMELPALPNLTDRVVEVPVTGTCRLNVLVFEGDGYEAVQAAAAAVMGRLETVHIKPDEVGSVVAPFLPMGLRLVDDERPY